MQNDITVQHGIKLAMRHPRKSSEILAKTLADLVKDEEWVDDTLKMKFCLMFISNLLDKSIEKEVNTELKSIKVKIEKMSFLHGIQLLRKRPKNGLKILVTIVMEHLCNEQKFEWEDLLAFCDQLAINFFPELTLPKVSK